MKTKTKRWQVIATFDAPDSFDKEHPVEAVKEYLASREFPRFTALIVVELGGMERRRYKVVDDRGTLEQLSTWPSDRELR